MVRPVCGREGGCRWVRRRDVAASGRCQPQPDTSGAWHPVCSRASRRPAGACFITLENPKKQKQEEFITMAMQALLEEPEGRFASRDAEPLRFQLRQRPRRHQHRGPRSSGRSRPTSCSHSCSRRTSTTSCGCASRASPTSPRSLPRARYVLPDGQPIVWTSRFTGEPARRPPAGQHHVPGHVEARRGRAPTDRRHRIQRRDGGRAPPRVPRGRAWSCRRTSMPTTSARSPLVAEQCRAAVREEKPEFVFVGISFPKQQRVALAVMDSLRAAGETVPLFLLLGGSFEMYLGQVQAGADVDAALRPRVVLPLRPGASPAASSATS